MKMSGIVIRYIVLMALPTVLGGCDFMDNLFPPPAVKHHASNHTKTTHYAADAFVTHVALAQIELPSDATDASAAAPDLAIIEAYSEQKHLKPDHETVLVIEYQANNSGATQHIGVPLFSKKTQLADLLEVLAKLGGNNTLHDMHLAYVTVSIDAPIEFNEADVAQTRQLLAAQQQQFMQTAEKLAPLEEAQQELALIRFFIDHHFRDAAYIAVENVKQLLAQAPRDDADRIKTLSDQLEKLEGEMQKSMPYNLSNG